MHMNVTICIELHKKYLTLKINNPFLFESFHLFDLSLSVRDFAFQALAKVILFETALYQELVEGKCTSNYSTNTQLCSG